MPEGFSSYPKTVRKSKKSDRYLYGGRGALVHRNENDGRKRGGQREKEKWSDKKKRGGRGMSRTRRPLNALRTNLPRRVHKTINIRRILDEGRLSGCQFRHRIFYRYICPLLTRCGYLRNDILQSIKSPHLFLRKLYYFIYRESIMYCRVFIRAIYIHALKDRSIFEKTDLCCCKDKLLSFSHNQYYPV